MLSRAHLLIDREHAKFNRDPPWGIEAHPLTDANIFEWGAKIKGLKDSLWDGGVFRLYIKFDENFNLRPPQICFHTIPFHPNVDMITGQPCLEILDRWETWKESFSISSVLLAVQAVTLDISDLISNRQEIPDQAMLSNPVMKNAVNMEAAEMMERSPRAYRQMVLDCVAASQRVEAGLSPHVGQNSLKVQCIPTKDRALVVIPSRTASTRVSSLSFEDYHTTWCGIATSKIHPGTKNAYIESIKENPDLLNNHIGLTEEELQEQVDRQLKEHSSLIYGRFRSRPTEEQEKAAKLDKLDKMKKIYLPPRKPPTTPLSNPGDKTWRGLTKDDTWEREVDDLVAWSSKLDTDLIDV